MQRKSRVILVINCSSLSHPAQAQLPYAQLLPLLDPSFFFVGMALPTSPAHDPVAMFVRAAVVVRAISLLLALLGGYCQSTREAATS